MATLRHAPPGDGVPPPAGAVLQTTALAVGYGDLRVVEGVDLAVREGEITALLGSNGSGKTTVLRTVVGLQRPLAGEVRLFGEVTRAALHARARAGLGYIAENRSLIPALSVRDNLRLAKVDAAAVVALAPQLEPLLSRRAGLLSGGEQQLLSVGRALARRPRVLVVDEFCQGLAPLAAEAVSALLRKAADDGTAVLLVEQVLRRALALSDRFLVLRQGAVALAGRSADHRNRTEEIERLTVAAAGEARPR
ncbi:ABC transporter ATP-binding protein [Actinomadura sp. GTD37]|uniref:ABC transporter ATP-binding protein n=1 Tax=Actinomadura sp. GTD37 TaxID=1778030 RepID=UPI0035C19FF6